MAEKRVSFQGQLPGRTRGSTVGVGGEARTIFLLSPANSSGVRAKMLFGANARFDLAQRLTNSQATLGELYSFISGLYFRGKLAYAENFNRPPSGVAGVYVITAAAGLLLPQTRMTPEELKRISAARVDASNPEYRRPLDVAARRLKELIEPDTRVVLLGSVATPKYVEPLFEVFGERLLFPQDFLGRGDMSRGSLLLRCCAQGSPLEYAQVSNLVAAMRAGA